VVAAAVHPRRLHGLVGDVDALPDLPRGDRPL
jgi:hypothetical protein